MGNMGNNDNGEEHEGSNQQRSCGLMVHRGRAINAQKQ